MKSLQRGFTAIEMVICFLWGVALVGVGGWVANIVKLIGMDLGSVTGMLVARAIGIFVAPLGAVLGFF